MKLDLLVVLCLFLSLFWGTSITVFHNHIILHSHQQCTGFSFLHILANICYLWSFWWRSFWQVWGDAPLWCCFIFLWLVMLSIFSFACWLSVCFLWKNVSSGLLPNFSLAFFFLIELYELENNFHNLFHLIQHTQNILIQQVINEKNISEMFLHDCYWY